MATVQSHPFDPSLEDLPAWKKDLILRKRANSKIHGGLPVRCEGKTTPTSPNGIPPQQMLVYSVQGSAQLSSRSVHGPKQDSSRLLRGQSNNYFQSSSVSERSGGVDGSIVTGAKESDGEIKSVIIANAMRAPTNMYQKGLADCSPRAKGSCNGPEDDEADLEYGPGIVSRLKNRYMSIAMREARGRTSLRRYCSLEDLLDDDGPEWPERGRNAQKTRPPQDGSPRDYMKRARSMDSLALRRMDARDKVPKSHSSGTLRIANLNALGNEDIIIIETTRPSSEQNGIKTSVLLKSSEHPCKLSSSSSLLEEEEMPAPDIVKQVKQIFESTSGRPARGTAAKVAAYKAVQAKSKKQVITTSVKPALKAKPPQLQARKSFPSSIEDVKSNLKQVSHLGRAAPQPRATISAKPVGPSTAIRKSVYPAVTIGLTPVTASVTSPCVNGNIEQGIKRIKSSAVNNIRQESLHEEFNFTSKQKQFNLEEFRPRPHSPVANLPPSPTLSPRVNMTQTFKCETDDTKEKERVLQENKKNSEKSKPFMQEVNHQELNLPSPKVANNPTQPTFQQQKLGSPPPIAQPQSFPLANSPTKQPNVLVSQSSAISTTVAEDTTKSSVLSQRTSLKQSSNIRQVPIETSSSSDISTGYNETSSLLEVIKAAEAKDSKIPESSTGSPAVLAGLKSSKGKDSRRNQQDNNTTLVFNFSKRTDTPTPDYIENDGVDLSKRHHFNREPGYVIMPGYDGKNDSSTDDFDEDLIDAKNVGGIPPPCNIFFEGEAVIINGRSNLQRQPRTKKLEITFDMDSTRTFEYPSEVTLEEEFLKDALLSSADLPSSGGLANYTPSNLLFNESFELGVSRRAHPPTPPREKPNPFDVNLEEDVLRPADETETITWSEERAPDMLF